MIWKYPGKGCYLWYKAINWVSHGLGKLYSIRDINVFEASSRAQYIATR